MSLALVFRLVLLALATEVASVGFASANAIYAYAWAGSYDILDWHAPRFSIGLQTLEFVGS